MSVSLSQMNFSTQAILPDISIIIPTLGRSILEQSLYWIVTGSNWPGELIVVDQGSSAVVAGWVKQLLALGISAQHIPSSQRGRAAGVNRGLELVRTQFVAITDDDCFVDKHWLHNMHNCLQKYPEAIVTGRVEAGGNNTSITVTSPVMKIYRKPRLKFDSMSGGNMGTSQTVVQRIGLFDEDICLRTAEDTEWSYRALRRGVPIVYEPGICVHHLAYSDKSKRYEHYRNYASSHGGFYGKYIRGGDMFILVRSLVHHYRALRRWLCGKLKGDVDLELLGKAYFTGLLPGIIAGFRSKIGIVDSIK